MTDIHGGLPLGAVSETGEEGVIRWDHSQMIIVKFTNAILSAHTLTGVAPWGNWIRDKKKTCQEYLL